MTDIEVYQPPAQLEQYQPALAMSPEQAKALDDQVRACTKAVLREGTDYGVIPGTGEDRKVLLKPGAEKLLQWFGFGFDCRALDIERDGDGQKVGVTYRCAITKRIGDPLRGLLVDVATCEGYAGYDEPKFYQSAEEAQRKAEAKERHWAAKDKRVANPTKWQNVGEYRAPWNTVIKMAQKRAIVGATIDATAAAGLFGTDEDEGPVADDGPTWYEQALEQAISFTAVEDGQRQLVEASHAARDGLCTPGQATHVKNRIRQRMQLLQNATPVTVEDLGRAAAAASTAAAAPAGPRAEPEPPLAPAAAADANPPRPENEPAADMPENEPGSVGEGQLTRLHVVFTKLGFGSDEREQKLAVAETITGRKPLHGPVRGRSSKNLSWTEAATLIDTLDGFGGRDALIAYMAEREQGRSDA